MRDRHQIRAQFMKPPQVSGVSQHTQSPLRGKMDNYLLHGVPYLSRDTIAGDMPKLNKQSLEMARAAPLRHEAFHT